MEISCQAILFDNDGVLVDSHAQVIATWTQLAEEFGLDAEVLLTEMVGRPSAETLSDHLGPDRLGSAVQRLEDLEVELAAVTPAIAGALELTAALPSGRWAIATSASRRLANARWAGAGITPPAATITADDISKGKPDPEPFLAAARLLHADPATCVVFEDSPPGGQAGVAAGATVIAVGDQPWDFEPAARVPDLSAVTIKTDVNGTLTLHIPNANSK